MSGATSGWFLTVDSVSWVHTRARSAGIAGRGQRLRLQACGRGGGRVCASDTGSVSRTGCAGEAGGIEAADRFRDGAGFEHGSRVFGSDSLAEESRALCLGHILCQGIGFLPTRSR
jgi:hypothetical protein